MANMDQEELFKRLGIATGAPQAAAAQDNIQSQVGNGVQQPPVQGLPATPGPGIAPPMVQQPMPSMYAGPSKEERELRKRIEHQEANDIMRREGDINIDRQALQNEANKSAFAKADLSPIMQLAAIAGANPEVAKMYKAPVDQTKDLRAALEKNQEGLASSQNNFLKNQLDRSQANQSRQQLMQDRLNERVYGGVITGIQKDPTLHDLVEKSNNITRIADVAFSPTVAKNTTSLNDLQQTVTGALSGLKGTGGVSERSERYMSDMATDLAKLKQRFGDTDTIPDSEPILRHYMQLAHDGQKFLQEQAETRLKTLASGHENITNQPGYNSMLNQYLENTRANVKQPIYMNSGIATAPMAPSMHGAPKANAKSAHPSNEDINKMSAAELKAYLGQ